MHEYTKQIIVNHNLKLLKTRYYDLDAILNQLINVDVHRTRRIKDSDYEVFLYLTRLHDSSNMITLNIELYDSNYNEQPVNTIFSLFETESECRAWLINTIDTFIDELNQVDTIVYYFDEFPEAHCVFNGRMLAAIFDFNTGKFIELPEVKTTKIIFEKPDIDKLIDKIKKD